MENVPVARRVIYRVTLCNDQAVVSVHNGLHDPNDLAYYSDPALAPLAICQAIAKLDTKDYEVVAAHDRVHW